MNTVHLICNAHLDPVWLWEWDEGAAEAVSTFRTAVEFCNNFEGFIFNHNEAILYKWVEDLEPDLFKEMQRLVSEGKWHIMGGWYLQPDCNMPSGESFIRQILLGRQYFFEKFGKIPSTAINFDPFGHTRGLVQILKKAGYDSYIVCRPEKKYCKLPGDDFIWRGYDGSEITVHRADTYNSQRGQAADKVLKWIDSNENKKTGLVLWGIGDHGGGPSKIDLMEINKLLEEYRGIDIKHSTPEDYFHDLRSNKQDMPVHESDLNPWAPGCYTSQIRVKQKHRLLENELYFTEKMISNAYLQGIMQYPQKELYEILCDLAFSEFHDILPGTSFQTAEESALRLLDHGLEILSRLKAKAFITLAGQFEKAGEGEIPVFIYNPHPFSVKGIFECEFNLPDLNFGSSYFRPLVYKGETKLKSQVERERSNLNVDWRKRIVFEAELAPSCMNRFNCKMEYLSQRPSVKACKPSDKINFITEDLQVVINCRTGLIDRISSDGYDFVKEKAFRALVISDDDDSWGSSVNCFTGVEGAFELMTEEKAASFSGIDKNWPGSVRIIEDGEVRTVVEALYTYGASYICQTYMLPKRGKEIEVLIRVYWNEKKKMLKLSVPTTLDDAKYLGQVAFGVEELPVDGREAIAQKWTGVFSKKDALSFTCINDCVYGSSFENGEQRITLLRSSAYSSLPVPLPEGYEIKEDRFMPRMDQGERNFHFWFKPGIGGSSIDIIDREALTRNEKPYALSIFPKGTGKTAVPLIIIEDNAIQMTAFKKAEKSECFIIRLFEPTGKDRLTNVTLPFLNMNCSVSLKKFEVKTFKLDVRNRKLIETEMLE